jgi:hypothetical protein
MDTRAVPPRETIALTACALHVVWAVMALLPPAALPVCLAWCGCRMALEQAKQSMDQLAEDIVDLELALDW